jgi:hypothetical protein
VNIDGVGTTIRLYSTDTDDLGLVTAPLPVVPDDVVAFEHGPPLRIMCPVTLGPGGRVSHVAEVEEARLPLVG